MATEPAQSSLRSVGYRRAILVLGAAWGAAPALTFGLGSVPGLSSDTGYLVVGALITVTLGAVYELDSRTLARHGEGVPLAWSYALVAPISVVAWSLFVPALSELPLGGMLGILVGPPASALLYLFQRGRLAAVE